VTALIAHLIEFVRCSLYLHIWYI